MKFKNKEEEAGFGRTIWQPWPPVWRKQVGILGCESYESPFSQSQLTSCPHGWVVYYKNWREEPRNPGTDSNRHVQHNTYTTMGSELGLATWMPSSITVGMSDANRDAHLSFSHGKEWDSCLPRWAGRFRVEDESTTSDLVKVSRERLLQVDTLPITNQVHRSGKLKRMSDTPTGARLYSTRSFSNPVRVLSRARSAHLERVSSRSRSEQVQSEKKKERKKGECELEKTTSSFSLGAADLLQE
ncbi:uncharacterized protein LOC108269564 [Ictalurus punctatus]|uniref:Uncharacterized protein LOC108269564 n=1 Tax=Ictalurus punctatus TaxID=7998 RepID=A0A9F7R4F9_ICTPU|nr:uncharacterized protein LOC108269564 [Ictalurus punctatus]